MAAGRRGAGPKGLPGRRGPAWFPPVPVLFLDGSRPVFAQPWVPHRASRVSREESREGGLEAAGPGPERAGVVRFELAKPQGERRADLSRQCASVSFIACRVLTPSSKVWAPQPPAPATVSLPKPRHCGFRTAVKDPSTYGTGGGYALRTDLGLCAFEQVGE